MPDALETLKHSPSLSHPRDRLWPAQPFQQELIAKAHRPVYRMHRYFARRPYNLFSALVDHYTLPGDLVLDPFMGGGVTLVESGALGRRAIGFDTSPLAAFVTYTELAPLDVDEFKKSVERVLALASPELSALYATECRKCHGDAEALWLEHSLVHDCPECGSSFVVKDAIKLGPGAWECKSCLARTKVSPTAEGKTRLVQILIECSRCGSYSASPTKSDLKKQSAIDSSREEVLQRHHAVIPTEAIPDCNMQRESALHKKGFSHFRDFFTTRQLSALAALRVAIATEPTHLQAHLLLTFSSTLRFANRMVTRNESWRGDRPLEWVGTGYWVPTVFLDANVASEFARRASSVVRGKQDYNGSDRGGEAPLQAVVSSEPGAFWSVETRSSTIMPLPDESIDAIITDPPYGSYVHYADMSNFWNVWLPKDGRLKTGSIVDDKEEAVVARKQFPGAKNSEEYRRLLQAVFVESFRVLKSGRCMVLTFNNREPRAWAALLLAAVRAGFTSDGVHFQSGVANYRHTARTRRAGSVHGDFVFTFRKPPLLPDGFGPLDQAENPLTDQAILSRLEFLLSDRPLRPEQLLRNFYESLIPDLVSYIAASVKSDEDAAELLIAADRLDLFNSERRQKLEKVLVFDGESWSSRRVA